MRATKESNLFRPMCDCTHYSKGPSYLSTILRVYQYFSSYHPSPLLPKKYNKSSTVNLHQVLYGITVKWSVFHQFTVLLRVTKNSGKWSFAYPSQQLRCKTSGKRTLNNFEFFNAVLQYIRYHSNTEILSNAMARYMKSSAHHMASWICLFASD